jgi:hypothetical protein
VVKTYDRGFVHTVRGPLGSLIGGVCGRCGGRGVESVYERGEYGPNRYQQDCPHCHGTGRTPGVLRELVKREPVMTVEVTDREPCRHRLRVKGELVERWAFWSEQQPLHESLPHVPPSARVPPELLDHMDSGYPTPAAARAALSAAIMRLVQPVEVPT